MENAVEALKIAAAVFIFLLGLVMLFNMSSLTRQTAEIIITENDPVKYFDFLKTDDTKIDSNGNRIVSIDEIIPVLYRYSEENYGVTIVDKSGEIVARFDLDTEVICNNWLSVSKSTKYKFVLEQENIYKEVNTLAQNMSQHVNTSLFAQHPTNNIQYDDAGNITSADIDENANRNMEEFFKKLYSQTTSATIRRPYYCYWVGNMSWMAQRIDSDLSRNKSIL